MIEPVVLVEFGEEGSKQQSVATKSANAVSEHGVHHILATKIGILLLIQFCAKST